MKEIILNGRKYMVLETKPHGYRQLTDELYMGEVQIISSMASNIMGKPDAVIVNGPAHPEKGTCVFFARSSKALCREEREREEETRKKAARYVI